MNTATATAREDRLEQVLSSIAWQLAQCVLGTPAGAADRAHALVRRLPTIIEKRRRIVEQRRATSAMLRMSNHHLRDLGMRRGDLVLLAAGSTPPRGEV